MATKHLITVDEFAQMATADYEAYELVDGELIPLPSPTPLHGMILCRIAQLIQNYFDRNSIGGVIAETDCRVIGDVVRRPDLSIFLGERWQQLDLKTVPVPTAPDIAVEVYSPSEYVIDATRKVREYLNSGSQEVWLLDSENLELQVRTKAGIRILDAGDVLETPLLPGFSAGVSMLLAGR
jgi:Uma2 family endonuclease